MLGGHVGALERRAFVRVHGTHVDDGAAAAGLDHFAHAGARGEEGAVQVDGQHLFPLLERVVDDGTDDLDARVADQDIDAAEVGRGIGHALVDLRFAGDIHGDGKRLAA